MWFLQETNGKTYWLQPGKTLRVGRGETSDIQTSEHGSISRSHFELLASRPDHVTVTDTSSIGTTVDGTLFKRSAATVSRDGSAVTIARKGTEFFSATLRQVPVALLSSTEAARAHAAALDNIGATAVPVGEIDRATGILDVEQNSEILRLVADLRNLPLISVAMLESASRDWANATGRDFPTQNQLAITSVFPGVSPPAGTPEWRERTARIFAGTSWLVAALSHERDAAAEIEALLKAGGAFRVEVGMPPATGSTCAYVTGPSCTTAREILFQSAAVSTDCLVTAVQNGTWTVPVDNAAMAGLSATDDFLDSLLDADEPAGQPATQDQTVTLPPAATEIVSSFIPRYNDAANAEAARARRQRPPPAASRQDAEQPQPAPAQPQPAPARTRRRAAARPAADAATVSLVAESGKRTREAYASMRGDASSTSLAALGGTDGVAGVAADSDTDGGTLVEEANLVVSRPPAATRAARDSDDWPAWRNSAPNYKRFVKHDMNAVLARRRNPPLELEVSR